MSFVRTLCRCGLGMLLLGASPLPADRTTGEGMDSAPTGRAVESPAGTDPAKPGPDAAGADESADSCAADQACIDRYLWSLYARTPKIDTVNVKEPRTVTVKRKGKTATVSKTDTKIVEEDFGWKDPKAAGLVGMSVTDFVIGGMDQGFKGTLYHALRALDDAGFKPGIMCAFRDDYRQSIATGLKAQNDRSFHGGSFRGGYGHGMAADIVSVRGETRTERLASSVEMWDFIDAHESELGIGRPYLDRDPPHVAPIDGEEYADHRLKPKMLRASVAAKNAGKNGHKAAAKDDNRKLAVHNALHVTKRESAHPSRAQSKARTRAI
jgi:hypothetical protein